MGRKKTNSESESKDTTKLVDTMDNDKPVIFNDIFSEKKKKDILNKKPDIIPSKKMDTILYKKDTHKDKKVQNKEMDTKEQTLNTILTKDDKLLFSLNILGSIQVNEKLIEKDDLISIDDRWFFQSMRRWWSEDSRDKTSNKTLIIISDTEERLLYLLEEYYMPLKTNFNNNVKYNNEKKRLINKYFLALNKAKKGLENCRDTYTDQFTKNKFTLSIQKTDDLLNKLQNYDRIV